MYHVHDGGRLPVFYNGGVVGHVRVQVHEGGFEPLRDLNPNSDSVELFSGHKIIYKDTSPSFVCTIADKRIFWASARFGLVFTLQEQ